MIFLYWIPFSSSDIRKYSWYSSLRSLLLSLKFRGIFFPWRLHFETRRKQRTKKPQLLYCIQIENKSWRRPPAPVCAHTLYTYAWFLRKIPPDCVLYSKYILSKSLAEFSPHLRYSKYSRSKTQSCLLYLQILFTAFPTYAAVYFQFVAHTLVHSDKADPASSSPSPRRFSCIMWLITSFLGLLLFSVKKKKYKELVQQVVPREVETNKSSFLCIYVLHHLIPPSFSHQLAWVCGRACSLIGSVQWTGWDECASSLLISFIYQTSISTEEKLEQGLRPVGYKSLIFPRKGFKMCWHIQKLFGMPGGSCKCIKPHLFKTAVKKIANVAKMIIKNYT